MARKKALVLGATGHIGNAILRELIDAGCEVTAASRHPQRAPNLIGLPVNYVRGDYDTPGSWRSGLRVTISPLMPPRPTLSASATPVVASTTIL